MTEMRDHYNTFYTGEVIRFVMGAISQQSMRRINVKQISKRTLVLHRRLRCIDNRYNSTIALSYRSTNFSSCTIFSPIALRYQKSRFSNKINLIIKIVFVSFLPGLHQIPLLLEDRLHPGGQQKRKIDYVK